MPDDLGRTPSRRKRASVSLNWPDWYRVAGGRLTGVDGWWFQLGPLLVHRWTPLAPARQP